MGRRTATLRTRQRVRRRRVLAFLGGVALVVVAALAFTAWQALQARDALAAAQPQVQRLQEQLAAGQHDAARATLADLQQNTGRARELTSGPVWWAASKAPWVGDDVTAARAAAAVTHDVAHEALPPLVQAAQGLDPATLAPKDGAVDLAPLQAAAPHLAEAETAMNEAERDAAAVDTTGVHPSIAGPVKQLRDAVAEAASTTATATRAARLVPSMLGAEGPRSYLVLFQNNAEVRATGGIPGAFAVVHADGGRVTLGAQGSAGDIGRFDEPVLPLDEEFVDLHTTKPGRFLQDVNFTPDFPTSAQLAREMWRLRSGQEVDGVLSADPVALGYLLRATGPVPLDSGAQLTADNAVDLLLAQVYRDYTDPIEQNEFFAMAAASVFTALVSGSGDPAALVDELAHAAGERRLLMWSAHEQEQRQLAGTVLEGRLPEEPGSSAVIGVYLNDGTEAKMDYYLRHSVTVFQQPCRPDGYRDYGVQIRLESTAPADAATSLPAYVLGSGVTGQPAGHMRTTVLVYAPLGGAVVTVRQDGAPAQFVTQTERGRAVGVVTVDMAPGQTVVLEADVIGPDNQDQPPRIRTTPGVISPNVDLAVSSCEPD